MTAAPVVGRHSNRLFSLPPLKAEDLRKNLLKKYIEVEPSDSELARRSQGNSGGGGGFSLNIPASLLHAQSQAAKASAKAAASSDDCGGGGEQDEMDDEQDERDLRRYEIQCELSMQGASDLVVDLFMSEISNKVFKENVLLAIALLEGGNTQVQVSCDLELVTLSEPV